MQANEKLSLEQIQAFLEGSEEVVFEGRNRAEVYSWVNQTLGQQRYGELKRSGRGLVLYPCQIALFSEIGGKFRRAPNPKAKGGRSEERRVGKERRPLAAP